MIMYIFTDVELLEVPIAAQKEPVRYVKSELQDGIVEWWEPAP